VRCSCPPPPPPPFLPLPSLRSAFYLLYDLWHTLFHCVLTSSAAVHQRESQEYLKTKIVEQMKERRKKEIIVERYEAKLKEEAEMLAYQAQRASESRQRSQGQRSRNTRAAGVCYSPAFYHQLSLPTASQYSQSSSRRSNPSASRRATSDEEGPAPLRGNVGSARQRRPQEYDEESEQGRGVRRPPVSTGGRRSTASEDEEEQQAVYSRRPLSSTASKSRGMVVGDEPPAVDEEYDVQPVGRRGGRGSSVEYQPNGIGASSSSSRSRRVQA
jgi:hypothetical protein